MKSKRRSGNVLLLVVISLMVAGAVGNYVFQKWRIQKRHENERMAMQTLNSIRGIQYRFQSDDLDGNGVNDFWTGDLAGLYNLVVKGREIQLVDRALAESDPAPCKPLVSAPRPFHGYYFVALESDDSDGPSKGASFREDTGGTPTMGKVHHMTKFGYCAYPAVPGVSGSFVYLIGTNGQIMQFMQGPPPKNWPPDSEGRNWNRCWGGG